MQQRCPRCKSDRIRHGYRPTPLLLKLVCRYNLLCDNCNWEFSGFAIPGTIPSRSRKRKEGPRTPKFKTNEIESHPVADEIVEPDAPSESYEEPNLNDDLGLADEFDSDRTDALISSSEDEVEVTDPEAVQMVADHKGKKKAKKVKKKVRVKLSR